VKKRLTQSCRRKFRLKFPDTSCPSGGKISKSVKEVRTHSILIDTKPLVTSSILTDEKLHDIGGWLEKNI
jgi:hypothetical protein